MRRFLFLLALTCATPVVAETQPMTDAFGIAMADSADRARWAGYRETMGGAGQTVSAGAGATVQLYLGDKSLVAGKGESMALALVLDAAGNLAEEGTAVTFTLGEDRIVASTRNGITGVTVGPFTGAGQFHAGAAIAGNQSRRAEYVVTSDIGAMTPVLARSDKTPLAEDFHDLSTEPMTDGFGNLVGDGTGLSILIRGADASTTLLPSVVVGGIARSKLLARDIAATGEVQAVMASALSAPQPLAVQALRGLGPVAVTAITLPDAYATRLTVGPFLTDAGHVLSDGSPVSLRIFSAHGEAQNLSAWTLDGEVSVLTLLGAAAFPLTVEVTSPLGIEIAILDRTEPAP